MKEVGNHCFQKKKEKERRNSKWMPLEKRNTWNIDEYCAQWIVA
jgi:hypothetical protein